LNSPDTAPWVCLDSGVGGFRRGGHPAYAGSGNLVIERDELSWKRHQRRTGVQKAAAQ